MGYTLKIPDLMSYPLPEPNPPAGPRRVGIVVPVYNEEEALPVFHRLLRQGIDSLPYRFLIYYVDDGSTRRHRAPALDEIRAADSRVSVLELSRNFGHQAALTAGLDAAEGDYVITLDGDGQHPPALIAEMLRLAEFGRGDRAYPARRAARRFRPSNAASAGLFYRLINRIGETQVLPGGADFRLLARNALDALKGMREYHRFLRGMVSWMGFRTVILPYQPTERLAGQSKYTLRKMIRLARDAVFSFSLIPLYIGLSMGALMLFLALLELIYVLSFWVTGNQAGLEPGWSSLMFVILVVSGILMILLGFIGVYIGFIFQEVKGRPVYILRKRSPAREVRSASRKVNEAALGRLALAGPPFLAPLFLLGLCVLAYGLWVPRMGWYWDDLPIGWIARTYGSAGLERYFSTMRPVWGLLYRLTTPLLGTHPLAWQVFAIFWRWISGLALWWLLRLVWPKRADFAVWASALFVRLSGLQPAVHLPGVQPFFHRAQRLSGLAGACPCRRCAAPPRWLLSGLAWVLGAVQPAGMEYFFFLELVRPLLFWIVLGQDDAGPSGLVSSGQPERTVRRVVALHRRPLVESAARRAPLPAPGARCAHWLPYAAGLVGVIIWRTFFFPSALYQPVFTARLKADPAGALLQSGRANGERCLADG